MTLRERILSVYRGERPDVVPYMLDLSHWFYHRFHRRWDLSITYERPETELIDYHRRNQVGFYLPNLAPFYRTRYVGDVRVTTRKETVGGEPAITWRLETPSGGIERTRIWNERTYSWQIDRWGFDDEKGLRVFREAMCARRYEPDWDKYRAWDECVGDGGVVYLIGGYSAMGALLNNWMGIEGVSYATVDFPAALHEAVDAVNANMLELVDLLCTAPGEVVFFPDNFSGDVQPPAFFDRWSRRYYAEAVRRLHAAGKRVAVHIDGRLRGALGMIRDTGADCADAVTPAPMGDLPPAQSRAEAGPDFILSGGVPPTLWLPGVSEEAFRKSVLDWLALKESSPRLIANAGDQVPPGAPESRILLMRDLVEEFGRYDGVPANPGM
ncbi:MAG: hypothetical protein HYV75_03220 [Opitutae bacterium]|nr:hypothetical protein [Opitutae bacterium]